MYRRLNIFLIIGAVFTIITGTLLHFVYEWSGESLFVGIFSPINESVWEHLKLLFFPMSVWILIGYFIFGKKFKTYIPSAVIGIISGMILIPMTWEKIQNLHSFCSYWHYFRHDSYSNVVLHLYCVYRQADSFSWYFIFYY